MLNIMVGGINKSVAALAPHIRPVFLPYDGASEDDAFILLEKEVSKLRNKGYQTVEAWTNEMEEGISTADRDDQTFPRIFPFPMISALFSALNSVNTISILRVFFFDFRDGPDLRVVQQDPSEKDRKLFRRVLVHRKHSDARLSVSGGSDENQLRTELFGTEARALESDPRGGVAVGPAGGGPPGGGGPPPARSTPPRGEAPRSPFRSLLRKQENNPARRTSPDPIEDAFEAFYAALPPRMAHRIVDDVGVILLPALVQLERSLAAALVQREGEVSGEDHDEDERAEVEAWLSVKSRTAARAVALEALNLFLGRSEQVGAVDHAGDLDRAWEIPAPWCPAELCHDPATKTEVLQGRRSEVPGESNISDIVLSDEVERAAPLTKADVPQQERMIRRRFRLLSENYTRRRLEAPKGHWVVATGTRVFFNTLRVLLFDRAIRYGSRIVLRTLDRRKA